MAKPKTRFQQVPLEVVKQMLEQIPSADAGRSKPQAAVKSPGRTTRPAPARKRGIYVGHA
jgi:hypothetical protein